MPRKPWVKLSTSIISSTTWKATRSRGIREFLALMVLADEKGVVDAINVAQLPLTVYCNSDARCTQKCRKSLAVLQQIGSILQNDDGTITLPKYGEYQYFSDHRPNAKYRQITPELPQRRADKDTDTDKEQHHPPAAEAADLAPHKEFQEAWNGLPPPFAKAKFWTEKRKAALRTRWKSKDWQANWKPAMAKMTTTPFLRGESQRGWVADVDWFLKSDSVARILEGKYQDTGPVMRDASDLSAEDRAALWSDDDDPPELGVPA